MRLLKNPNFDFMSKKLFALTISGLIGLAGIVSLIFHGGPKLSIDFKGGTFVAVQFAEDINVEEVRSKMGDVNISIPSNNTQRIQEGHLLVEHIICEQIENSVITAL